MTGPVAEATAAGPVRFAALPPTPPQPWAGRRAGIRRGAVERHIVTGRTPGEEREAESSR
ncbi:hypothetical protein [Streptomyces sp. D54]|uniref:hypothetical protein n=1 Tax=Streptomyces sp. D54 TaxID=1290289 RepID=UPI003CF99937